MPTRRVRAGKSPTENEQAEIETMLKRLEEPRRAASNSELRAAYQAAIDGLDGVLYRLAMLRALRPPERTPLSAAVFPPSPATAPASSPSNFASQAFRCELDSPHSPVGSECKHKRRPIA